MSERTNKIRHEVLLQLYGLRPLPKTHGFIGKEARQGGYDFTDDEIRRELQFLADEGLVIKISEPGTTAALWRIHAAGVRHYEEHYG